MKKGDFVMLMELGEQYYPFPGLGEVTSSPKKEEIFTIENIVLHPHFPKVLLIISNSHNRVIVPVHAVIKYEEPKYFKTVEEAILALELRKKGA